MSFKTLQQQAKVEWETLPMPEWKYGIKISAPVNFPFAQALQNEPVVCNATSNKVQVVDFANADPKLMNAYCMKLFPLDSKIIAYHAANITSGTLIYVPPNTKGELVTIKSSSVNFQCQHILVVVDTGSSIEIVDENRNAAWSTHVIELVVHENGHAKLLSITATESTITLKRAQAMEGGSVEIIECIHSSSFVHSNTAISLLGREAEGKVSTVFYGRAKEVFDISSRIDHLAPFTISRMTTKGILTDSSKAIVRGNIDMHKVASKSKGKQVEQILLLSKDAEVDPIPMLQAETNDIECSHSAAIGRIDPEILFYMNSRGLSEEESKKVIITGFFDTIDPRVSDEMREVL